MEKQNTQTLLTRNPATLELLGETRITSPRDVVGLVEMASLAQRSWGALPTHVRLQAIEKFRRLVFERRSQIAELITKESGKPLVESLGAEIFGVLESCRWLQHNAPALLAPRAVHVNGLFFRGKTSYNVYEPLGVVAVVSPWNFPFSIPAVSILMALTTGNTVVFKPSPKTPLVSKMLVDLLEESGLGNGKVALVNGDRDQAAAVVTSNVSRVIFTGSVGGGRAIMGLAAEHLHPVTLELGGKHPAIVLEDADLERAAEGIVWGGFTNGGQACASIERVYVVQTVARQFAKLVADKTRVLRLGNGLSPNTDVGPVIDEQQLQRLEQLVADAVSKGARIIAGGKARRDLGGYFFEPTVLVNVSEEMRVMQEEIFGPILPIRVVSGAEEAIALANQSHLGLGSSIWTSNILAAQEMAQRVQAGMVWINDGLYSHACPDAPWGGVKQSGFGTTHGAAGLYEFVQLKHIGADRARRRDWHYPYSESGLNLVDGGIETLHGSGLRSRLRGLRRLVKSFLSRKWR